jgi:hypothetical protein
MPLDAAWHDAHPMPNKATLDQRIAWHTEHAAACGCRPMPATMVAEIARRKGAAPATGQASRG